MTGCGNISGLTIFFIYCDCGLRHQKALGAEPDLIVGDFDSHEKPETDRETIVLPVKKDDTDTVFAAKEAMRRGLTNFAGRRFRRTAGSYAGECLPAGDAAGTGENGPCWWMTIRRWSWWGRRRWRFRSGFPSTLW